MVYAIPSGLPYPPWFTLPLGIPYAHSGIPYPLGIPYPHSQVYPSGKDMAPGIPYPLRRDMAPKIPYPSDRMTVRRLWKHNLPLQSVKKSQTYLFPVPWLWWWCLHTSPPCWVTHSSWRSGRTWPRCRSRSGRASRQNTGSSTCSPPGPPPRWSAGNYSPRPYLGGWD